MVFNSKLNCNCNNTDVKIISQLPFESGIKIPNLWMEMQNVKYLAGQNLKHLSVHWRNPPIAIPY